MKLATFRYSEQIGYGAVLGDEVINAAVLPDLPNTLCDFLAAGEAAQATLQSFIASGAARLALADVTLLAPIPRPGKYLGVGLNYRDHIEETGFSKPDYPLFFNKQTTCVIGPGQAIIKPKISDKVDYEGELAIIIGRTARDLDEQQAREVIAGYSIANDVSMRDWQMRSPTWTLGKSFDSHGPLGPWLVTADEIGNPQQLRIQTWVDQEPRQDASTASMIFSCYELVAYLSQAMTLEAGDIIATGTPAGVGVKMKPRGYLRPGQTVKIAIDRIGCLTNPVVGEPN
ncbi:MAG: fumarylacetoacetate hydrolase family protein [Methylococcales bacterium]|nr:fumarylacetoacetate hydrolase family protein [Methylococcales bacterium]